jgi:hypothetical protein
MISCAGTPPRTSFTRGMRKPSRQAGRPLQARRAGLGLIEPVAGIMRLGDDRIESRAVKRRIHFIGNPDEAAVNDRERDRIERLHRRMPVLLAGRGHMPR